jgi:surface antigen
MGTILGGGALGGASYFLSKGGKYAVPITVAGTAIGALVGSGIGDSMDKVDQLSHLATMQIALEKNPIDEVSNWSNPENGTGGAVVPKQTFQKPSGQFCRSYEYHIMHDTKVSSGKGLACRNDKNGKWETIGSPTLSTL